MINISLKKIFLFLFIFIFFVLKYFFLNGSNKNKIIDLKQNKEQKISVEKNDKWIVITSINDPTEQIDKLSSEKDFRLLVVADFKTNI